MRYFPFLWLAGVLFMGACKPVIALQWDPTVIPVERSMVYKSVTQTETALTLPDKMTATSLEITTTEYTLALQRVHPDGSSEWTQRVLRFRKERTQGDSTQVFDSALPPDGESIEQLITRAMKDIELHISVAPNGDVVQIGGMEAMIDQVTNTVPLELQPTFRQTMTGLMGKNNSLAFGHNLMTFTPNAQQKIKKGKPWTARQPLNILNANADITYELHRETPQTLELITDYRVSTPDKPEKMDLGSVQIQMSIKGTGEGSVSLDKQWKTVRKMFSEYMLSGNMEITIPTMEPQKMPVHLHVKSWLEVL
jgi:hypothetical protein